MPPGSQAQARWTTYPYRARRKLKTMVLGTAPGKVLFRVLSRNKHSYRCPICAYLGPFADVEHGTGQVRDSLCPGCGLYERHRLQYLVMNELAAVHPFAGMTILHVAPEPWFRSWLSRIFGAYAATDLDRRDVDFASDLLALPLADASVDVVFASHVLEHVANDTVALKELARILRPGGFAVLPVPVVAPATIEYPEPSPFEEGHVRAPGPDYFDKYRAVFHTVRVFTSEDFPSLHQLYTLEDRTQWPPPHAPRRVPMPGGRHLDYTPVCFV